MTATDTTEHAADRVEAATNNREYIPPTLPDLSTPIALSGMRRNTNLQVFSEYVQHYSNCVLPKFWLDPCDPAYTGNPDKCTSREWDDELFRPFMFYDVETAPCVDPLIDPQAMANQVVTESTAWALTTVLQNGAGVTTATLQSTAVDVSPASLTPLDPVEAVAKLLMEMSTRGIGRYTVHAPLWALPVLETTGVVRQIGGTYRGPANVPFNFGIGFTGTGPDIPDPNDPTLVTNLEGSDQAVYLYATRGAVEYNIGDVTPYVPQGTLIAHRQNRGAAEALRPGIVTFDPGCVFAVLTCLKKVSCCA